MELVLQKLTKTWRNGLLMVSSTLEKTSRYCMSTLGSRDFQKEILTCAYYKPCLTHWFKNKNWTLNLESNKGNLNCFRIKGINHNMEFKIAKIKDTKT